jgi:hypothetical protein
MQSLGLGQRPPRSAGRPAPPSASPVYHETFRPLEVTARASAQISAKYRANPILPLSLHQKVHPNVAAMRECEFLSVSW